MIAASVDIPYSRSSRPSYICWSADVSGAGFLTTTPNGRASIITTINGKKKAVLSIFLEKLVLKVRRERGQASSPSVTAIDAQSVKWVADREILVAMATRKSKESKETSSPTAMDLSLQGKSATLAYMIQKWPMICAGTPMIYGKTLKKFFRTEVIAAMSQLILRMILELILRY